METGIHRMCELFRQLGLPDDVPSIEKFIHGHRPLAAHMTLADAAFWSEAQAGFLKQKIAEDADWAELVDQLDAALR